MPWHAASMTHANVIGVHGALPVIFSRLVTTVEEFYLSPEQVAI